MNIKIPSYSPRELEVIANADRVVARVYLNGQWKEQEFFPDPGQTVRERLEVTQHALRHHRDFSQICLYLGAEINGERATAAVPHDYIPLELKR